MTQDFWSYYGVDSYGRPVPMNGTNTTYPGQAGDSPGTSYMPPADTPVSQAGGQQNAPAAPITEAPAKPDGQPRAQAPAPPVYPTYQKTTLPRYTLPTYTPGAIPQYQAPETGDTEALQKSFINKLLLNPETFSPDVMGAIQAQIQKEATTLGGQQKGRILDSAAARGVGVPGYTESLLNEADRGVNSNIVSGRTALLIQKAQQDAADRAQAQQLAESYLNGTTGRAQGNYGATLQGVQAREGASKDALASLVQQILFNQNQDLTQLDENHFDFGTKADAAKFAEGQRTFNEGLGFNYAGLEAAQQAELIRQILGV